MPKKLIKETARQGMPQVVESKGQRGFIVRSKTAAREAAKEAVTKATDKDRGAD